MWQAGRECRVAYGGVVVEQSQKVQPSAGGGGGSAAQQKRRALRRSSLSAAATLAAGSILTLFPRKITAQRELHSLIAGMVWKRLLNR